MNKNHMLMLSFWYETLKPQFIALISSWVDYNCISSGISLTKYCSDTIEKLSLANGSSLHIDGNLEELEIINNHYTFKTSSLIVKNISHNMILGTPSLNQLYMFYVDKWGSYKKFRENNFF